MAERNTIEDLIRITRAQAWERAKGELQAVLATFYGEASASPGQFEALSAAIDRLVEDIETHGWME